MAIYVETLVHASMSELWHHTQEPALHARWDLRFSRIDDLRRDGGQRRFRYCTSLLGMHIDGVGTTVGERRRPDGSATSALRFGSGDRRSLILSGSGYWRYRPCDRGVRFLTGYDYATRWGRLGALVDLAFRPVFGWATAWSFDRLRLWLERGVTPERALRHAVVELGLRGAVLALAVRNGPAATALTAPVVLLLPPSPWTPAARRCLRRPPDRLAATAPGTLRTLERP